MTSRIHSALIAASIVLPFVANQAHASIVTESFTGTITGDRTTDNFGWFGTFGVSANLSGASITGSYSYDPSLMDEIRNSAVDTYLSEDANPAAISVTISINGHSYTMNSSVFGQVETSSFDGTDPGTYELDVHSANSDNDASYTLFGGAEWVAAANPALIDSPVNITNVADFPAVEQQFSLANGSDYFNETLSFEVNSTSGPTTSTPEPVSTSLLLAGLFGLTAARWRRRG